MLNVHKEADGFRNSLVGLPLMDGRLLRGKIMLSLKLFVLLLGDF